MDYQKYIADSSRTSLSLLLFIQALFRTSCKDIKHLFNPK